MFTSLIPGQAHVRTSAESPAMMSRRLEPRLHTVTATMDLRFTAADVRPFSEASNQGFQRLLLTQLMHEPQTPLQHSFMAESTGSTQGSYCGI